MLRLPREAQTSHRARAARCRSWHRLLKSVRHDRASSFGTQCDRVSLTRGAITHCLLERSANFISHIGGFGSVRCGIARHKARISRIPQACIVHTLYLTYRGNFDARCGRAPRSAIHSAFLSVHFTLAYRAAFRHALPHRRAQPHYLYNTQAGAFYSGRRIAATFGTR